MWMYFLKIQRGLPYCVLGSGHICFGVATLLYGPSHLQAISRL